MGWIIRQSGGDVRLMLMMRLMVMVVMVVAEVMMVMVVEEMARYSWLRNERLAAVEKLQIAEAGAHTWRLQTWAMCKKMLKQNGT